MSIQTSPDEFAGKRVLVSGGTKGLGRATVERLFAGGAQVITAARTIKDTIEGVEYLQADLATAEGSEAPLPLAGGGWVGVGSNRFDGLPRETPSAQGRG